MTCTANPPPHSAMFGTIIRATLHVSVHPPTTETSCEICVKKTTQFQRRSDLTPQSTLGRRKAFRALTIHEIMRGEKTAGSTVRRIVRGTTGS